MEFARKHGVLELNSGDGTPGIANGDCTLKLLEATRHTRMVKGLGTKHLVAETGKGLLPKVWLMEATIILINKHVCKSNIFQRNAVREDSAFPSKLGSCGPLTQTLLIQGFIKKGIGLSPKMVQAFDFTVW